MSALLAQLTGLSATFDIIAVIALFGAGILYGLFAGRNKLILVIIATYLALVISPVLPFADSFKKGVATDRVFAIDIGIFLGLIIIFYFLIKRSVARSALRTPRIGDGGFLHIAIFAILAVGLILAYSYSFLSAEMKRQTTPILRRFIFSENALFWWTIVPLAGLLLIRKKETER